MNLRLLGTSVVLACAIAVFAAPVIDAENSLDIEAGDHWKLELAARDIGTNVWPKDSYHAHGRRAKSAKAKVAPIEPGPKQSAPKQPSAKQATPQGPPPKGLPPQQTPPKQLPPQQPPLKQLPPQQPPLKQLSPQGQPPLKQLPSQQQPPVQQKSDAKNNDVCSADGGMAKRAFSIYCDTNWLTLNGVTRSITKAAEQGNSAITYSVSGGWPDPAIRQDVPAFAKTGRQAGDLMQTERGWLWRTRQLLAEGTYDGRNFIVFRAVAGRFHITATQYYATLYHNYLSRGDIDGCVQDVRRKLSAVIPAVRYYVDNYRVLHTDLQPGNILWDQAGSRPYLIDWGRAREVAGWSPDIEAAVRSQLEFSHLQGAEKICIDLRG